MSSGDGERSVQLPYSKYRPAVNGEDGDHATGPIGITMRRDEFVAPLSAAPLGVVEQRQLGNTRETSTIDTCADGVGQ